MNYIHPTALIGPNVVMGDNNYIGPYCIIGFPAEHKGFWPNEGKVIIGSNCVITGHCTIDAGTERATVLENGVWMLKHSHVGHDAFISNNVTISCGAKVGGHTLIGASTNIGLNAVIHQSIIVPSRCMIGMGAVVTKKTQMIPQQKYAGNPAKRLGVNEVK